MVRIGLAGLLGALVLFVWSFVSWVFIPWHVMGALPDEPVVARSLANTGTQTGVYVIPGFKHDVADLTEQTRAIEEEAWAERHRQGPLAFVVFQSNGETPMAPTVFLMGFVLHVMNALLAAWLLSIATTSIGGYMGRVLFVTIIGAYVAVGVDLANWNWMSYPTRFSLEMAADKIVSALLLGLVLAAIIKPPSNRAAAIAAVT